MCIQESDEVNPVAGGKLRKWDELGALDVELELAGFRGGGLASAKYESL